MATNTAATLTGRGVNVELLMALVLNDLSESLYAAIISINGSEWSYEPLLKKISYSGGEFVRVGADILLHIDENLGTKQSRLPRRLQETAFNGFELHDSGLREPQPLRFFVRQSPKISPNVSHQEAVGICFDSAKSLPPGMAVSDWSSEWIRWEGGRFRGARIIYLLEYQSDEIFRSPDVILGGSLPGTDSQTGHILRVLQFCEENASNFNQLTLCTGLQQFSTDSVNTPLPYHRPWCDVVETPEDAITANPDRVLGAYTSTDPIKLPGGGYFKDPRSWPDSKYVASFELQLCYGRIYYLIKIAKRRELARDRFYPATIWQPESQPRNRYPEIYYSQHDTCGYLPKY